MRLKVKCAECGKEGKVLILFGRILSRKWWFFGRFSELLKIDYWECWECREND